jgi:M6 family metalloprotease-like protein
MPTPIHSRPARLVFAALAGALVLLLAAGGGGRAHAADGPDDIGLGPMAPGGKPIVGPQPFAILLCRFADKPTLPNDRSYYERLFGIGADGSTRNSPRGSVDHYWREVSYNTVNPTGGISLDGSKVFGWVALPEDEAAYLRKDANGNPVTRSEKLTTDCTAAAETYVNPDDPNGTRGVNFNAFKGIAMFFNGALDGHGGGGRPWDHTLADFNGQTRTLPTIWITADGSRHHSVVAHELGHAFGLNHSSGSYKAIYDSMWDVMSGGERCPPSGSPPSSAEFPFGCEGAHTIAAHKEYLGWIPAARKYTLAAGDRAIVKLSRLAQPGSSGVLLAKVPIPGSATQFYSVELRQDIGYDIAAPGGSGGGVVIHKVDYSLKSRNAQVVDPDGDGDVNDGRATWGEGETFTDPDNHITIRVDSVNRDAGTAALTLENKPAITIADVTVSEPSAPATTSQARFTVRLSHASSKAIGLDYFTTADTATKDVDYVHAQGHLSIPAGATTATITVNVKIDTAKEQAETFLVNLKNPIGATIADNQARGTILDRAPTMPSPTPIPCPPPAVNCQVD